MNKHKVIGLTLVMISIVVLVPATLLAQPAPQTLSPLPTPTCDPARWYPPESGCPVPPPATMPVRPTPLPTCDIDQSGVGCVPFRPTPTGQPMTPTPDAPPAATAPGSRLYLPLIVRG